MHSSSLRVPAAQYTHPIQASNSRSTRSHITKRFDDFKDDLTNSVKSALPSATIYDSVAVLSLTYSACDFDTKPLEDRMCSIFGDQYNYKVERYAIETEDAAGNLLVDQDIHFEVLRRLRNFVHDHQSRYTRPGKRLLIISYSGHGCSAAAQNGQILEIYPSIQLRWKKLNWQKLMEHSVTDMHCDVLGIIDCCSGSLAGVETDMESMVACGSKEGASAHTHDAFTKEFCDLLETTCGQAPSMAELHTTMVKNFTSNKLSVVPHHIARESFASIRLLPLRTMPTEVRQLQNVMYTNPGSAKIMLTIHLQGGITDVPSAKEWARWLKTNIPAGLRDIEISHAIPSGSYIIIVTLPHLLWLYLPESPSYIFVAREDAGFRPALPILLELNTELSSAP